MSAKRSISEAIDAQKPDKNAEPERKFIKANNYYLHNFNMGNGKSSPMHFRLTDIVNENKRNREKEMKKYRQKDIIFMKPSSNFFKGEPEKRFSSSPAKLMNKIHKGIDPIYSMTRMPTMEERGFEKNNEEVNYTPKVGKDRNDFIYKSAMLNINSKSPNGPFLKNSMNHIRSLDYKMKEARKLAKYNMKQQL